MRRRAAVCGVRRLCARHVAVVQITRYTSPADLDRRNGAAPVSATATGRDQLDPQ